MSKISVIGLGYVGLPTAVLFAQKGHSVVGIDINASLVEKINKGASHLVDMNIDAELAEVVKGGSLKASASFDPISTSDFVIMCVPTLLDSNKNPDLSPLEKASAAVGAKLKKGSCVVVESSIYPGVTEDIVKPILEKSSGLRCPQDFGIGFAPERLNPGDDAHSIHKITKVVSGIDERWAKAIYALYASVLPSVYIAKNIKTAESAKIIENVQRDVNIALMNDLAIFFEKIGVDFVDVIDAAKTKWNFVPYQPGPGVGGYCVPVNPYYLAAAARKKDHEFLLIPVARDINDRMPLHVVDLVEDGLNEAKKAVNGSKIVFLGLSYKPQICDVRATSLKPIFDALKKRGAKISIYEPFARNEDLKKFFGQEKVASLEAAIKDADCVILATHHDELRKLDLKKLKGLAAPTAVFVDTRLIYSPQAVRNAGFIYRGIGRP